MTSGPHTFLNFFEFRFSSKDIFIVATKKHIFLGRTSTPGMNWWVTNEDNDVLNDHEIKSICGNEEKTKLSFISTKPSAEVQVNYLVA